MSRTRERFPRPGLLLAFLPLLTCLSLQAQPVMPEPNWTLRSAREAAGTIDLIAELKPLFAAARAGRDQALLRQLRGLAANETWPIPARERVLHAFALGLGDLQPGSIGPGAIEYLLSYQPRTLVPHDDHAHAAVPLFNVRAAMSGSINEWDRQVGAEESLDLLRRNNVAWVGVFRAAGPARQGGLLAGLESASDAQLRALASQVLHDLPGAPELTLVVARSALLLSDLELFQRIVVTGRGAGVAQALRAAAAALDEPERAAVLRHATAKAPAANASLAVAELAPGLLQQPETVTLLLDLLGDRQLGPAAALALSASTAPLIHERLAQLAAAGAGLPSKRAAIALATARQNAPGGEQ
jgi:hypothetical protein